MYCTAPMKIQNKSRRRRRREKKVEERIDSSISNDSLLAS